MRAVDAVLKQRGKSHGDYGDWCAIVQEYKKIARLANWDKLSPVQRETLDMIFVKIGRILIGDPNLPDHWVDIEGYARLAWERLK